MNGTLFLSFTHSLTFYLFLVNIITNKKKKGGGACMESTSNYLFGTVYYTELYL